MTREESSQRTRAELLSTAFAVLAREGFGGASVDRIAREAGYTKGAFYAHFASKEDLFLQFLEQGGMGKVDILAERLRGKSRPEAIIHAAAAWASEQDQEDDIRLMVFETIRRARLDKSFGPRYEQLFHAQWLGIGVLLAPIFAPAKPPVSPLELGALVMELVYGNAMTAHREPSAGELVEITLRALRSSCMKSGTSLRGDA